MNNQQKRPDFANYKGQSGERYHEKKYESDEAKSESRAFVERTIARVRLEKFQPFVKETDEVLEYGVGKGYNLRELRCRKKVGYDLSEYCRKKVEPWGIEFTSDIQEVIKRRERFDVVICHHVLEHVPNPTEALLTIQRLLKPSGRFLLYVPYEIERRFRRFNPDDPDMHLYSWSPQSICNLLISTSFEVCDIKIGALGYERFLAPLAKLGFWVYKAGIRAASLVRPSHGIMVVAKVDSKSKDGV